MYKDKEKDKDESSKSILLTAKNSILNPRPQTKLNSIIEKAKTLRRKSYDSPLGRSHYNLKKTKTSDINAPLKRFRRHRSSIRFSFLEKKSPKELFALLRSTERKLFQTDLIIFLIDLLIIILMFLEATIQTNKNHSLTLFNNVLRIAYICISIGIIIIIVLRRNTKVTYKMIEYLLRIKSKYPRGQKKKKFLIFEICIHCVNLIPFYSPMLSFKYNGIKNYFCFDILICLIATVRLYTISSLYQSIIQYYRGNLNRLIQQFNIYNLFLFYIKKSIISKPLTSLFILFWVICLSNICLFVIMECHASTNNNNNNQLCNEFSLSNLFWLISNFLFQLGDGKFLPQTITGKILIAFIVIPGMFYNVIFPSLCYFYSMLSDDKEKKTYRLIQSLSSKGTKKSMLNSYYNDYIKNKITKIKMRNKSVMAYLFASEEQERNRERYYLQIRALFKIQYTLLDFSEQLNQIWNSFATEIKSDLYEVNDVYNDFIYFSLTTLDEFHDSMMEYYKLSTQTVNLCYMIILCGGKFEVNDFTYLKGYKIITMKNYIEKCREFEVKRCDLTRQTLQYTIDSSGELNMPINLKIYDREIEEIGNINMICDSDESDSFITEDDNSILQENVNPLEMSKIIE